MNQELKRNIDAHWSWHLKESPEAATRLGHRENDHRWTDLSPDAVLRRKQAASDQLTSLDSVDPSGLGPDDEINYKLFRQLLEHAVEGASYHGEFLRIGPMGGPQSWVAQTVELMPATTASEIDNILARLKAIPQFI
ncbi:MAG: DUF885 family protein, partial [Actinomycetota bacterium]